MTCAWMIANHQFSRSIFLFKKLFCITFFFSMLCITLVEKLVFDIFGCETLCSTSVVILKTLTLTVDSTSNLIARRFPRDDRNLKWLTIINTSMLGGHSTTARTKSYPIVTPIPLAWTNKDILNTISPLSHPQSWPSYWLPTPSSCPRSYWMLLLAHVWGSWQKC